jgi:dipeptidyl aminopeptidase/acylaminoacyl peptidase
MSEYPEAPRPARLFDDPADEARWRSRFTAARVSLPEWADDAEHRTVYVSNASGVWEVYTWDRATDAHRKLTDRPNGTVHCAIEPGGGHVWWFADTDGDEFGDWMREPFSGGDAVPALPGTHAGYPAGLALGRRVVASGAATDDGITIWVRRDPASAPEVVYASTFDGGVAALSEDERLLAIEHSEHGDNRHPALRVLSVADGSTLADKHDGPGKGLDVIAFAPVTGDSRLLVGHERRGRDELLVWDVEAGTETEIVLDLPGEIGADWYPDGSALLVSHTHSGRDSLYRYDLATGTLSALDTRPGTIGSAHARRDGAVEYSWSDSATPPMVRSLLAGGDAPLLAPPGPSAPESEPVTDAFVDGVAGTVHALVSRPEDAGDGPLPAVFSVHGGPHAADEDRFSAYRAAWLDAGFAVVAVNYRGSTGYGSAWRDAIEGRPGLTELEDIAAVQQWAVRTGLADPRCCVVNGASWGGYLALLALGTQPDRWAAGVAAVPVADYHAAYADEMEPLRAFDRALFGGSPCQVPDVYTKCSPLTYVDEVVAPVLVLAGDNDPRCPIRQIHNYLDRLAGRGAAFETYFYEAGHGSLVVSEVIEQTAVEVDFTRRALGMG